MVFIFPNAWVTNIILRIYTIFTYYMYNMVCNILNWERIYIYKIESVCLFVLGKRQNYGTNWRQTLRNCKERPGKCPLQVEIAHLSVLGEISWYFRFFVRGQPRFFIHLPFTSGSCLDSLFNRALSPKWRRLHTTSLLIIRPMKEIFTSRTKMFCLRSTN